MVGWFKAKVALHDELDGNEIKAEDKEVQSDMWQQKCSFMCDEVVNLWRLAALNPGLSHEERHKLRKQLSEWHLKVVDVYNKQKRTGNQY